MVGIGVRSFWRRREKKRRELWGAWGRRERKREGCVRRRRERVEKKRGEERREWMGLDVRERFGWSLRGTRAKQFNATSSGRPGIRLPGSVSESEEEEEDDCDFDIVSVQVFCLHVVFCTVL